MAEIAGKSEICINFIRLTKQNSYPTPYKASVGSACKVNHTSHECELSSNISKINKQNTKTYMNIRYFLMKPLQ